MSADLEQKARELIKLTLSKDKLAKSDWMAGATAYCKPEDLAKLFSGFARSVVSDIVGRLEARIAFVEANHFPGRDGEVIVDELTRQVAELKKEYLEK